MSHESVLAEQAELIARDWAQQQRPQHLFVGLVDVAPDSENARVTLAMGGVARERVTRVTVNLRERRVTKVQPVEPLWLWRSTVPTQEMLDWIERCWPTVERLAVERGVREAVCTAMFTARRYGVVGARVLWLCVEDLARPAWANRHATLRFAGSGELLTNPAAVWTRLRAPRP